MNLWRWITGLGLVILLAACTAPQPNQTTLEPEANYWQQLGSVAGVGADVSLASDGTSNTIAFVEFDGSVNNIRVKKWTGSSWANVGSGVLSASSAAGSDAFAPSLSLDSSGNPVVAWNESDGLVNNIYVQRFNGTSWVNVGSGVLSGSSAASSTAYRPSLSLDSSG
jgi:hypothetical protein